MTSIDHLKTLADYAIDYGSKKTNAIIARVVQTKNSQIRFSQNDIDISKKWEELKIELFLVIGEKTGTTEQSITSQKDVKRVVKSYVSEKKEEFKGLSEAFKRGKSNNQSHLQNKKTSDHPRYFRNL